MRLNIKETSLGTVAPHKNTEHKEQGDKQVSLQLPRVLRIQNASKFHEKCRLLALRQNFGSIKISIYGFQNLLLKAKDARKYADANFFFCFSTHQTPWTKFLLRS